MISVFVSSTSRDLQQHRAAVIDILRQANKLPIAMETFGSMSGDAETVSLREVRRADVFVGIYARRYGYRPDDDKSVTELEYLEAKNNEIDRLVFIVDDDYDHPLLDEHAETNEESKVLLAGFLRRLSKENVRATFTTPDDLAKKVLLAISGWMEKNLEALQAREQKPAASQINIETRNQSGGFNIGTVNGTGHQFVNNTDNKDNH